MRTQEPGLDRPGSGEEAGGGRGLWWGVLAVMLVAVAVFFATGAHEELSVRGLVDHYGELKALLDAHWWTGLLGYVVIYATVVALSVPGALVLTVAGGLFFGWTVGGPVTILAATLGATAVFLLARTTLGAVLARRAGPRLEALRRGFSRDAASYLLFLRLVPLFPFWLVNLAPALLGVSLTTFVATTLVGIAPGTMAFAFLGAGLDSVVVEQAERLEACRATASAPDACRVALDPAALMTPDLFAGLVALGLLALVPMVVRRVWRPGGPA